MLDRRPAEHYGGLTLDASSSGAIERFARELGLEPRFFQTNHEGEFVEELHRAPETRGRADAQPGRVDALRVGDARRARGRRRCRRSRCTCPTSTSARTGARVSVIRDLCVGRVSGQGRRRLPRGARAAEGGARGDRGDRDARPTGSRRCSSERELDALLVTDLVNVRYLTGFTGIERRVRRRAATRAFVTDFRYVEQAGEQVPGFELRARAERDLLDATSPRRPDAARGRASTTRT